ncbi:hypothetical protein DAPPUDRAFT_325441 [Daphnia pulex]|nr:hypothetical protein DAPPUDRAFT_325441 [Daphnia pulex]|eukprot:EFX73314.1 hypothetical protein DAPPUDRAFT_325441 [Daphnia pulex]
MANCLSTLSTQNAEIGAAKVPRHRLPSIEFTVGLVMNCNCRHNEGYLRRDLCVIVSWDESFRVVSLKKWGMWWEPITHGFNLKQPYYHVIFFEPDDPLDASNHLYVPQEALELWSAYHEYHDYQSPHNPGLFIYFKCFDGHRYVPNDEHAAHFPEDDAVALSLIDG